MNMLQKRKEKKIYETFEKHKIIHSTRKIQVMKDYVDNQNIQVQKGVKSRKRYYLLSHESNVHTL